MSKTRREFLTHSSLGLMAAAGIVRGRVWEETDANLQEPTPGAPPAFGTGPAVGPEVSPATFAEAEKLVQVELTEAERAVAARSWRVNLASVYERRTGPRRVSLEPELVPWSRSNSVSSGRPTGPPGERFVRSKTDPRAAA